MKPSSIKPIVILLAILLCGVFSQAQDITGQWNGILSVQGMKLRLVFHIEKTNDGYASTMDSPDQKAVGIPVASTTFDGSTLSLNASNLGIRYEGQFKTDSIVGTFKQSGMSFPLTLKKTKEEPPALVRPQEPKPPYLYRTEDVTFENADAGVTLSGTLTMPATGANFTAVVLITGSGAQNRDEEIMGHKPFLVIADYLTQRGIAVLRYDDRGTAHSTGNFGTSTTADFSTDTESAIAYLKSRKEINPHKIGLMGHSEGGIIASMVAARSKDVAFIVMLAGTGMCGDELLLMQTELIAKHSGTPENMIAQAAKLNALLYGKIVNAKEEVSLQEMIDFMTTLDEMDTFIPEGVPKEDFIKNASMQITAPWTQYFLRYNPASALEKVKCPVLAVNGAKDLQVPSKENLTAISAALKKGGNENVTIKEYSGLNHLFQECTICSPDEYATIEQTFSSEVLKDLGDWILFL